MADRAGLELLKRMLAFSKSLMFIHDVMNDWYVMQYVIQYILKYY